MPMMPSLKLTKVVAAVILLCFMANAKLVQLAPTPVLAQQPTVIADQPQAPQEKSLEAEVVKIVNLGELTLEDGQKLISQELELKVTTGSLQGQIITVKTGGNAAISNLHQPQYQVGDKVRVSYFASAHQDNQPANFIITGYLKRGPLLILLLIFVASVLLIGRKWGLMSLIGMAVSFLIIFKFVLPQIIAGHNPILIALIASLAIIPLTFYLSHGWKAKTHVAVIASLIALVITGLLAQIFVQATHLTGLASEEAGFLQVAHGGNLDLRGLLLAGIILGTLGILDDITIGQASTVSELKKLNPKLTWQELYHRAMKVGQDHISSMVNTLVLVYAGAALPLLLLFLDSSKSFIEVLDYELITEEVIRTLVGSIGLVLVAPLATVLAAIWLEMKN
ncbi:MAG: YibE/F family protein [Candidatus Pacebacteria bacterium]|nr:YibE/F family protein [Candidatus Paceibacterota bacterium]